MTSNKPVVESWSAPGYAESWRKADGLSSMLEFPWAIAAALVKADTSPALIVDVGSGPGTFLAGFLAAFPEAHGVWIDAAPSMQEQAEATLEPYAGRVEYVVADAADLAGVEAARGANVVLNSRVAHHFQLESLFAFYRDVAGLLAPGGWSITLDHVLPPDGWDARYREVLPQFAGPNAGKPTHPHYFPFPSVEQHLEGLRAAGFAESDLAWRAFYSRLFVGRLADGQAV